MDSDKPKPYYIQVFSSKDNSLLNKFKFVLSAKLVSDLKDKVKEKLLAKKEIQNQTKLSIKDVDDYELASDDEVQTVVPDGKIRIYTSNPANQVPNNPENKPKEEKQSVKPYLQQTQQPQQQPTQVVVPPLQNSQGILAVNSTVLDVSNMSIPQISQNFPKDKILTITCPQIRKTPYNIEGREGLSFLEFSTYIVKQFNFSLNFKALLFNEQGQALLFSLDLMNMKMPDLDYSKQYSIIFTASTSVTDQAPVSPMQVSTAPVQLKVNKGSSSFMFKIDLQNSLSCLKYKIFKETCIHPANQIIKFANNPLVNDLQTLKSYGMKEGSIMELSFKIISNVLPSTFNDKFYYKDIQLINPQQVQSTRAFRSNLLAFTHHLSEVDKNKFLSFLRQYTSNTPLVFALKTIFNGVFVSQVHRIAIEQGFFAAIWQYISSCDPTPKSQMKNVFDHTRDFFGFIVQGIKKNSSHEDQFKEKEQVIVLGNYCSLTTKPIKSPGLIKLDNGNITLIDKIQLSEQIDKGFTFTLLVKPNKSSIFTLEGLQAAFDRMKQNQEDNKEAGAIFWSGMNIKPIQFQLPSTKGPAALYEPKIAGYYTDLKVHQPLEIKSKSSIYLLLKNKEHEYRIFVSKNKDINRPHNVFDVISGNEEGVNLDLMMAAGKTQNLEELVDKNDLKPVITRDPKEAIVVLFDISGSMGSKFFNEQDLKRIGAVKSFFEALAYRTIAYNFEHVVSLIFFDYQIEIQSDFTQSIYDFNRLVSQANPRGSTRLYDSIIVASEQLVNFKKRYPECILRIMAMTDGQDTGSSNGMFEAAKAVIKNNIIMDSFAVGTNCDGLKNITIATGGKCYLTRNIVESLKLFEQETVLSVRSRKVEPLVVGTSDAEIRECLEKAKYRAFDLSNSVHDFKMPEIKANSMSAQDLAKKYQSQEGQKQLSGNSSLKRIMKQIQKYNQDPHPFVSIYPCSDISSWKILLLGPKQTPYENGLFTLYAKFPSDYPFRAPEVRFMTPIYHCNMNQQGRICHSVFDRNYSPALTFRQIIDCVYGLILTPEPEDPLDNVIASYYLSEYPVYEANAIQSTKKNASKNTIEIVQDLFGKIADDIERQKKVEEINKWIQVAKTFNEVKK